MVQTTTRRERQREATYAEIVRASRELLADGAELSLRAVAARVGVTAPALYRYVASYQELVDVVAFEIDQAATEEFRAAAERQPEEDPMARLVCASVAFRRWALRDKAEFSLVFANPVAESACARREMITAWASSIFFHQLLLAVWHETGHDHPGLDELDPTVAQALQDPLLPPDMCAVPEGHEGLLWVFMQGWATLYGTVTLEVFGHLDPRVIESGGLFAEMLGAWLPRFGVDDADGRYRSLLRAELDRR